MANTSKAATRTSPKRRYLRKSRIILVIIVALAMFIAGSFVWQSYQRHQEKQQFLQAKADIAVAYNQIAAKFGQPDDHKSKQYCYYTSAKYARGDRFCDVVEYFAYSTESLADGQGKAKDIADFLKNNAKTLKFERNGNVLSYNDIPPIDLISQGYSSSDNRRGYMGISWCSLSIQYMDQEDLSSRQTATFKGREGIVANIGCSGTAKAEYFTVTHG